MNTFLPPSKTPVNDVELARFNHLYRKTFARLAPGTAEEESLCNDVVVGLWMFRTFRGKSQALLRRLKQLEDPAAQAGIEVELQAAHRQAKNQKNYAWRRRNRFFFLKTERENREKAERELELPMAA